MTRCASSSKRLARCSSRPRRPSTGSRRAPTAAASDAAARSTPSASPAPRHDDLHHLPVPLSRRSRAVPRSAAKCRRNPHSCVPFRRHFAEVRATFLARVRAHRRLSVLSPPTSSGVRRRNVRPAVHGGGTSGVRCRATLSGIVARRRHVPTPEQHRRERRAGSAISTSSSVIVTLGLRRPPRQRTPGRVPGRDARLVPRYCGSTAAPLQ